jgi:Raf kinase inhibitor-like YbhB/YbcL family protein
MSLELHSTSFRESEAIPTDHACEGADRSPPLTWSGAPSNTQSFALIVHDPDAPRGDFVHWVVFDIPKSMTALRAGIGLGDDISGARQGTNDFGKRGWGGPCPPPGAAHRYVFELLALDCELGLGPGVKRNEIERAVQGHVIEKAELVGRYERSQRRARKH